MKTQLTILLMASVPLLAQGDKIATKTLVNMSAVGVLIEQITPRASKLGLTPEMIRADVEIKLRLSGLRVLSAKDSAKLPGSPYLYVNVNVTDGARAALVRVDLYQTVRLERDPAIVVSAVTWSDAVIGERPSLLGVRGAVKDGVDQFVNDWLAANPK